MKRESEEEIIDRLLGEGDRPSSTSKEEEAETFRAYERLISTLREAKRESAPECSDLTEKVLSRLEPSPYTRSFYQRWLMVPAAGAFVLALFSLFSPLLRKKPSYGGYSQQAVYEDDRVADSLDIVLTSIAGPTGLWVIVTLGLLSLLFLHLRGRRNVVIAVLLALLTMGFLLLRHLLQTWLESTVHL